MDPTSTLFRKASLYRGAEMPVARFVRRLRIGEEKSDLRYPNIGHRELAVHYGKGWTLSDNAGIAVTEHRIGTLGTLAAFKFVVSSRI